MGRILTYGALIRSKALPKSNTQIQQQVIQDLIIAGKQRPYLLFISVSFLVEFVNQIDIKGIKKLVWPIIQKEFGKPWTEQNLDTFYTLLVIKDKCPSLVNCEFSKTHFGTEDIIAKESMNSIVKVLLVSEHSNFIFIELLYDDTYNTSLTCLFLIFRTCLELYRAITLYTNYFVGI